MADNTKPKVDWELLALTDQYSTAVAIREAVREEMWTVQPRA